jgi:hypothetical protein
MNWGYSLRVWYDDKGYEDDPSCKNYVHLRLGRFRLHWFLDCGEWFCYVYWGKRFWRWSTVGYLYGEI